MIILWHIPVRKWYGSGVRGKVFEFRGAGGELVSSEVGEGANHLTSRAKLKAYTKDET